MAPSSPSFSGCLLFSEWFAAMARTWALPDRDWVLLADAYVPAAFFSGLLQWVMACLAPLAFYAFLTRLDGPRDGAGSRFALWGALLLPLLPSISSFYSHWDVNYLLLISGAWFFALRGQDRLQAVEQRGVGRWLDWLWAGLLLGLLTWLSFGNAVICGHGGAASALAAVGDLAAHAGAWTGRRLVALWRVRPSWP